MAYPTLNANKVFAALYNQVISMQLYESAIVYDEDIVQSRKVDGTLFGDTKVFIDTDVLKSYDWSHNDVTYNLLTHKRPPEPATDSIVIDTFRQIPLTIDDYLTKQAWMNEGSFAEFTAKMLTWITTTRSIFEHTSFTAAILQDAALKADDLGSISIKLTDIGTGAAATPVELNMAAPHRYMLFSKKLRTILKELNEASRAYNDHGFLKNVNRSDYELILPTGVKDGFDLYKVDLPLETKEVHWKYFGSLITSGSAVSSDGTKRAAIEGEFAKSGGSDPIWLFPGDIIPSTYLYDANEAYTPTYTAAPDLLAADLTFLIINKKDYPILSAFSVATSFFNPKDLVVQNYLTFGFSNPRNNHLGGLPLLKVSTDVA